MKIKISFFTPHKKFGKSEPDVMNFEGNYAIETMLIKVTEKFFGTKIALQVESLLKSRINNGEE